MLKHFKSSERGEGLYSWLHAKYRFSFSDWYNPQEMGFSVLRVLNEDRIAAQKGFPKHSHQNAEIFTWVLSGQLNHKDSEGHERTLYPGVAQYMSAGSGISHSEYNGADEELHLVQIWLDSKHYNLAPHYQEKDFREALKKDGLHLLLSPTGAEDSLTLRQDAYLSVGSYQKESELKLSIQQDKNYFIFITAGQITVNKKILKQGDSLSITKEKVLQILIEKQSQFLYFELP